MSISQNKGILRLRLFLYSFLILMLELSLIRFIPANIRLIGYFANVILLATFLGMGCGMMIAKRKFSFGPFFPYVLLILFTVVSIFKLEVVISSKDAIFFSAASDTIVGGVEPQYILPLIFILSALANIPLAQALGRLFGELPPLEAYSCDIAGSITGIVLFTALSFLSAPAGVWFAIIFLIYAILEFRRTWIYSLSFAACVFCVVLVFTIDHGGIWSPYYKITVTHVDDGISFDPLYSILVNNIPHQYISHYSTREPFYYEPYRMFRSTQFKRILIIGSGTGADVATALGLDPTVEHIDAVEIDPTIAQLGLKYNPDKPYQDKRVTLHVDDGRSFLQNSKEKYDLIIYALTDSLALTARSSNIRLESFIFTTDSFQLVKNHLTDHGLFTLYNYYREEWLIDKISAMTTHVFGYSPVVMRFVNGATAAVIMTGPKTLELSSQLPRYTPVNPPPPATDNWPFLYLNKPSFPGLYSSFIVILILISIIMVAASQWGSRLRRLDLRFFFFGAGFMLLETKSLATFALLFGTTWLVNSLVFASLLLFVLLANLINSRVNIRRIWPFYAALFLMLSLQFVVPPSLFIPLSFWPRLAAASVFYFCPIFFANIIFSNLFKSSEQPQSAFGINLLGSLAGGFLEYSSMVVGYQLLTVFVIIFYAIALIHRSIGTIRNM